MGRTLSQDTSAAAERVFFAQAHGTSVAAKVAVTLDLIATARALGLARLRRRYPGLPAAAQQARLASSWYGAAYPPPTAQPSGMPAPAAGQHGGDAVCTPLDALLQVIEQLERLEVLYLLGGSWASTAYGLPRYTNGADVLAALDPHHVAPLIEALGQSFYISAEAARKAVARRDGANFNVIPTGVLFKIDIFVARRRRYDAVQLARRRSHVLRADPPHTVFLASIEDTILTKLDWYRQGGGVSTQQWADLLGVLKVQGEDLDHAYLQRWASALGVGGLLARARAEAGGAERPAPP